MEREKAPRQDREAFSKWLGLGELLFAVTPQERRCEFGFRALVGRRRIATLAFPARTAVPAGTTIRTAAAFASRSAIAIATTAGATTAAVPIPAIAARATISAFAGFAWRPRVSQFFACFLVD